jgi:hypothetical protein
MDDLSAFDIGIEPWVADAGKSRHRRAVVIGPRVWFWLDAGAELRRTVFSFSRTLSIGELPAL